MIRTKVEKSTEKPDLKDIKDLDDRTVADRTRPSIDPQLPRTYPTKRVSAGNKRSPFFPIHAHATHRIIPPTCSTFSSLAHIPPFLLLLLCPIHALRLLNKSHQSLRPYVFSCRTSAPHIALGCQRHGQVHAGRSVGSCGHERAGGGESRRTMENQVIFVVDDLLQSELAGSRHVDLVVVVFEIIVLTVLPLNDGDG